MCLATSGMLISVPFSRPPLYSWSGSWRIQPAYQLHHVAKFSGQSWTAFSLAARSANCSIPASGFPPPLMNSGSAARDAPAGSTHASHSP